MAIYRHYLCPDCNGTFKFLHHPNDSAPPDRCQLCKSWMREDIEPTFVPTAPSIKKSAIVRSMDQTYRAMEAASIERAKDAAELAGVPESEMSHLKITNMKDPSSVRAGENSVIAPPSNAVGQLMKQHPGLGGGFNPLSVGGNVVPGQMLAAAAHSGDAPHAGERTRSNVVASHRDRAHQMQMRGQMGSYSGKG